MITGMRYDQMGLQSILANARSATIGQEPPSVIQAVANVFGELILLGVGLIASVAVAVFVSPLWGIVMATALVGGYYLWQVYTGRSASGLYNVYFNQTSGDVK